MGVRARPDQVFALVSDPPRKASLNPNVKVIRVEQESNGPVREGSVFYHRLQKGTRIFEYHSRCIRMVPARLFVSRGETNPPFEVRVTVEPTPEGCSLTQQETLEVTPELLDALEPLSTKPHFSQQLMGMLGLFPGLRHMGSEFRAHQRERLAQRLTAELLAWLEAIKAHLEAQDPTTKGALPEQTHGS